MKPQKMPTLEEALTGTLYGHGGAMPFSGDKIVEIEAEKLEEIEDQPFHSYNDEQLEQLAESIESSGQQQPCIIRKLDSRFIILAGRNRKRACELIGRKVKCIVRECSDEDADLILTDTNLCQRHRLAPSELAYAYKMQKEAYEKKGEIKSTAVMAESYDVSKKTIQRYIKLADLNKNLLKIVDADRIPVSCGVELTALSAENQKALAGYLENNSTQRVSLLQTENLIDLNKKVEFKGNVVADFFAGKDIIPPESEKPEEKAVKSKSAAKISKQHEKEQPVKESQSAVREPVQKNIGYKRMTERCVNGKQGYWSVAAREELLERLGKYEDSYPNGPIDE